MIPRIIHYIWVGPNKKNDEILKNIESWKKYLPDYEIQEWNETNFDISSAPKYVQRAYKLKKWAFVSDYIRLYAPHQKGGIYLDTDMEVIKNLDLFLGKTVFLGWENQKYIGMGIIGAIPGNWFIKSLLEYYQNIQNIDISTNKKTEFLVIPILATKLYHETSTEKKSEISVYPPYYFYPISYSGNVHFHADTYTIHAWSHSWGTWYEKLIGKMIRKSSTCRYFYSLMYRILKENK